MNEMAKKPLSLLLSYIFYVRKEKKKNKKTKNFFKKN